MASGGTRPSAWRRCACWRQAAGTDVERTKALRRYVLGLALTAFTANVSGYLRLGMPSSDLRLTVHFLQPYSHGRGEDGRPEWPPSPLRLFQALVASAVGRQVDPGRRARTIEALRWLELQAAPEIHAPGAGPR